MRGDNPYITGENRRYLAGGGLKVDDEVSRRYLAVLIAAVDDARIDACYTTAYRPEVERDVLRASMTGLVSNERLGELFGFTRERVRQIIAKGRRQLAEL